MMIRLIPKIFFNRMDEGLDLFVNCLGFTVLHQDGTLAVVGRDGAKAYVMASPECAALDRPEIAIETDTIEEIYKEVSTKRSEMLHPNLPRVTKRPWGALEFSLLRGSRRLPTQSPGRSSTNFSRLRAKKARRPSIWSGFDLAHPAELLACPRITR